MILFSVKMRSKLMNFYFKLANGYKTNKKRSQY